MYPNTGWGGKPGIIFSIDQFRLKLLCDEIEKYLVYILGLSIAVHICITSAGNEEVYYSAIIRCCNLAALQHCMCSRCSTCIIQQVIKEN